MAASIIVGVVTSASATQATPNAVTPDPAGQGVATTVQRVADTAESTAVAQPTMTGLQIAGIMNQKAQDAKNFYNAVAWNNAVQKNFYNTVAWDNAVAKNLAWDNAVAAAEARLHPAASTPPAVSSGGGGAAGMTGSVGSMFSCIRSAESGGNYSAVNSSSGAGGAYQFMPSTWASLGGSGLPENAPPAEQDAMAMKLYQRDGWSPWRGDRCVG